MKERLNNLRDKLQVRNLSSRQINWGIGISVTLVFAYVLLGLHRHVSVPYAVSIPGLTPITFYSLVVALAIVVAVAMFKYLVREDEELSKQDVWELLVWLLIPGLIGARLFYVATQWEIYRDNTGYIFALWEGGLNIWGGFILGGAALAIYAWRKKVSFWKLAGVLAVILPFTHMLGRTASFFAREYYGAPTTLPWSMYIEPQFRLWGLEEIEFYHPVFLYEMAGNLLIFLLLLWLWKWHRVGNGTLVKFYLLGYGVLRYLLDFLLITPKTSLGLTHTQIFILAMLIIAIATGWGWQVYHFVRYQKSWRRDK